MPEDLLPEEPSKEHEIFLCIGEEISLSEEYLGHDHVIQQNCLKKIGAAQEIINSKTNL